MFQLPIPQLMQMALQAHDAGRLNEAENLYRQVLAQSPNHTDALHNLGVLASQVNQVEPALELFRRAIALRPDFFDCRLNVVRLLSSIGRVEEASVAMRECITLRPNDVALNHNLATFLHQHNRFDEAIVVYRRVLELEPNHADCYSNIGLALGDIGEYQEGIAHLDKAIGLRADHPGGHANRSIILMLLGRYAEAWPEYEMRWKTDGFQTHPALASPRWHGEELNGKTVALIGEQGAGDTLHFIRYAALIAKRGGRVLLACVPPLIRLMSRVEGVAEAANRDDPLPPYDMHLPIMSLPLIFGLEWKDIPNTTGYVTAPPEAIEYFKGQIGQQVEQGKLDAKALKVGLAWAGNPKHRNDEFRSMNPAILKILAEVPNVAFFNLQTADPTRAPLPVPAELKLIDLTAGIRDYADTAGLVANLDLVITVDTSVAHLAAAMGKPTWIFIPYVPDWRWMLERTDNFWYPTVRLFRQKTRANWPPVVEEVKAALEKYAGEAG